MSRLWLKKNILNPQITYLNVIIEVPNYPINMLEVFFLRHGQTEWNAQGNRYCGRTDIPLTDLGRRQAGDVRQQLSEVAFNQVFSSPLERAYLTAEVASGGKVVTREQRLIEVDFGDWEGLRREEFVARDPGSWERWDKDPSHTPAGNKGETAMQVVSRVDAFFKEYSQSHPSGRIMVVAHNGVNRLYLAWKLGMPLKNYRQLVQDNSTITVFNLESNSGMLTLKQLNARF